MKGDADPGVFDEDSDLHERARPEYPAGLPTGPATWWTSGLDDGCWRSARHRWPGPRPSRIRGAARGAYTLVQATAAADRWASSRRPHRRRRRTPQPTQLTHTPPVTFPEPKHRLVVPQDRAFTGHAVVCG